MDQLPWLGKRELFCLLLSAGNYVVSVRRGFHFLWVLGMGHIILLWHSLGLSYNYYAGPFLAELLATYSKLECHVSQVGLKSHKVSI